MIRIKCDNCGKQYGIDENKLKGDHARFKCKACGSPISINLPDLDSAGESKPDVRNRDHRPPRETEVSGPENPSQPDRKPEPSSSRMGGGKIKKRSGITFKLLTVMLLVSILPLTLLWFFAVRDVSDRIVQDNRLLIAQMASELSTQVNEWVDKNVRTLNTAAGLSDIRSMDQYLQEPILKEIQKNYPWMYLVFTLDGMGMNVARNDGKPLKDYSDRQYYKDVLAGKSLAWQTLIGKTSKKPALVIAVPITFQDNIIGVMAAAMTINDISDNVARWKKGKTGFAFLVDEHGKVIAHQKKQFVLAQQNLENHPLVKAFRKSGKTDTLEFTGEDGQKYIGHVSGTIHGWALVLQQQADEVLADLKKFQIIASLVLVITIVLVTIIAIFSARAIVRPIRQLTAAAENMSLGDMNVVIDVKSRDEIGNLAEALMRMQTSLRMAIDRLRHR